jgi:hypothetical protein
MNGIHFIKFRQKALRLGKLEFANLPKDWNDDDREEWVEKQYRKLFPNKTLKVISYEKRRRGMF